MSLGKNEGEFRSPTVSPDGSLLAYTLCTKGCDIYVQELGPSLGPRGQPRRLTNQAGPPTYGMTWAADGKSVVYGSYIGSFNVWRVSIADPRPEPMELGNRSDATGHCSQREPPRICQYGHGLGHLEIRGRRRTHASRFFQPLRYDPQLSPDGRRIALGSERSGKGREIWIANMDGSGAVRITDASGKLQGTPRWSPDGRWIAYDALEESGEYGIYVIDAAGGSARPLTARGAVPSWSRDGKWIYFRSNRSGRDEIWRIPPTGGTPEQITEAGGIAAWESWDGTLLYYSRGGALYSRALTGGPERPGPTIDPEPRVLSDEERDLLRHQTRCQAAIFVLDPAPGLRDRQERHAVPIRLAGPYPGPERVAGRKDHHLRRHQPVEARRSDADPEFSLKLLPATGSDPDRVDRFVQEARAASALTHPNVAVVYDSGECDGHHFIAMEHVEGRSLAEHLLGGPLSARDVVSIGSQIAEALQAAHAIGIIHRDVKPANVMITPAAQVKVLDFGLAKLADDSGAQDDTRAWMTGPHVVMGTAGVHEPRAVDWRSGRSCVLTSSLSASCSMRRQRGGCRSAARLPSR